MNTYYGVLAHFFETGCEGSYWVLEQYDKSGYDELVFLENGDQLTIYDDNGKEVYVGIIKEDRATNLQKRPLTTIMQPVCNGHWVHWLQSGVDSELWGEWFCSGRFTGVLTKQPVTE
ncbi:MAG: hypothetical protein Q7U82_08955 [Gammaproteobacteria bacterium]|nr:hypothetical protein [Gammaproteobacteria bacterium]